MTDLGRVVILLWWSQIVLNPHELHNQGLETLGILGLSQVSLRYLAAPLLPESMNTLVGWLMDRLYSSSLLSSRSRT